MEAQRLACAHSRRRLPLEDLCTATTKSTAAIFEVLDDRNWYAEHDVSIDGVKHAPPGRFPSHISPPLRNVLISCVVSACVLGAFVFMDP